MSIACSANKNYSQSDDSTLNLSAVLPKTELHIHIEGTLEPELMSTLSARNNIPMKNTVEEEEAARENFTNLQDFLDLYYAACAVLLTERDFYDLMYAYLLKAKQNNIVYCEVFFDPQTHTERGVAVSAVINGLHRACVDGLNNLQIEAHLIMCFLRHLSEEAAINTLREAEPFLDKIIGVGLDSAEDGNPPSKFKNVFALARNLGLHCVAHAGEEGDASYVQEALSVLKVERIDHGVRCLENADVVNTLVNRQIPLTVCPCSNWKLKVNDRYFDGNTAFRELFDKGLCVTINSDDPAYFGGYLNDNWSRNISDANLTHHEVIQIAKNGFRATFLPEERKQLFIQQIDNVVSNFMPQ